jgi:hypothetical protein
MDHPSNEVMFFGPRTKTSGIASNVGRMVPTPDKAKHVVDAVCCSENPRGRDERSATAACFKNTSRDLKPHHPWPL